MKRREFLPGSMFLSCHDMTHAFESNVKPHSFHDLPSFLNMFPKLLPLLQKAYLTMKTTSLPLTAGAYTYWLDDALMWENKSRLMLWVEPNMLPPEYAVLLLSKVHVWSSLLLLNGP